MSLYYEGDGVILYHGKMEAETDWLAADFLVTDPPYGMAYSSNFSKYNGPSAPIAGDNDPAIRDKALAMWGNRPALVFGTWRVRRPAETKQVIVWDKGETPGMGDLSIPWGPSHEEIYVLGSGFKGKRGPSVIRSRTLGAMDAARPNHPTPKPVGLMENLLGKVPKGSIVADPFAGSGTTLVAARNLGLKAIAVELEERYCEIIATRLSQGALDLGGI